MASRSPRASGGRCPLRDADARAPASDLVAQQPARSRRGSVYVAGGADETACDVVDRPGGQSGRRVRVWPRRAATAACSGAPGSRRHPHLLHGRRARRPGQHRETSRRCPTCSTPGRPRSCRPRRPRRAPPMRPFELREPMPAMVPDDAELIAERAGGRRRGRARRTRDAESRCGSSTTTSTNARSPVLVGPLPHDIIVGAELPRRAARWPAVGTAADGAVPGAGRHRRRGVERDRDGQSAHPGAIVAGLGKVGELTPGALASTLAHALTHVRRGMRRPRAAAPAAAGAARRGGDGSGVPVTAILVGSGEGGVSWPTACRRPRAVRAGQPAARGPPASARRH